MTDRATKRFTICFLSSKHPLRDKRVFDKEAISLANAGFRVIHLAPDEGKDVREQGVDLKVYPPPKDLLGRLLQMPRLYRLAARIDADCYHCNEVDSWFVGVLLKLHRHKRVIFDVHEHYPSAFAEGRFPRPLRPVVSGMVRLVFRILAPFTDRLVFAKTSLGSDFPGTEHRQLLVLNFTSLVHRDVEASSQAIHQQRDSRNRVTAIHLGVITRRRGWPQLLEALAQAKSRDLWVHIVGSFTDGSQHAFEQTVAELGLERRILVEDWMAFGEAYQRILSSDIGLVLFQPGIQNHVYALPHKMFDYMLAGLPVIAPVFAREVAPIVEGADCGILVDTSSPEEIARALDQLAGDAGERQRLGENGRQAVLRQYNWQAEARKLVQMYEGLCAEG